MAKDFFLSSKQSEDLDFILDFYIKIIFQSIMPNISATKVLIARKSQFKVL